MRQIRSEGSSCAFPAPDDNQGGGAKPSVRLFFFVKRRLGLPVWAHVALALPSGDGAMLYDLVASRKAVRRG